MEEFIKVADHELKTPVTSIKMGIQLTRRWLKNFIGYDPASDEKLVSMNDVLERSERQVDTLNRLVGDLQNSSRMQLHTFHINPNLCDLTRIVRDVIYIQSQTEMKRTVLLEIAPACETVPIMADAERIGQVLTSYIINAFKYSAANSPVQVNIQLESSRRVRV